ncbi:MAG: WD40-repeat-containing domain protein [Podila humilis]|nr:MAG: WD40-repeat-containing domain protein [Podila humilis]
MATLNQYPPHLGPQSPPVAEYAFPSVLQFLQTEWRRFERDRNEWDIEKAEMKARIAFLEGEKRGIDSSKVDLMKRVKMLEYALRQERSKYVERNNTNNAPTGTGTGTPTTTANLTGKVSAPSPPPGVTNGNNSNGYSNISKAQKRMSTSSMGQNMTQVSPTTSTSLDLLGRAKSREFLRVCLQEISYLTSSVPQTIVASMPPAPNRLARQDSEKRVLGRAGLSRNRNSEYYPSPPPLVVGPPPMPRSNSVPVPTLQSLGLTKPTSGSPPLDMPITETVGAVHDESEDATLRQFSVMPQQQQLQHRAPNKHLRHGSVDLDVQKAVSKVVPKILSKDITVLEESEEEERNGKGIDEDEEPVTVLHSPISEEHWHAQLQKAGQKLKAKKPVVKEDEAQLSKDVQDKFNISTEKINRMVKEWDRSKDNGFGTKSMRKKKGRESSAMLDELAALSLSEIEAEEAGTGTKQQDGSLEDSAPRWRHKASLKRHLDTVSSLAFHPVNKSILTGSEDGTMRYWNLEPLLRETRKNVSAEIEPVHIYRGHTKSITSVAISADQNKCFSSSLDSTVRSWKLVPMDKETYSRADRTIPLGSFVGHTDVVWDIRLFPLSISSSQLLASISADGTLKIWDTETSHGSPLKSSWGYNGLGSCDPFSASGVAPTSVDFCPTDLRKVVVSYTNSVVKLFDIETGQAILDFKSNETYDGTPSTQINKLVCHPTMPVVATAHEDRYIRFFDLNSGACSFSMLSHLDAVSSLDIDPAGLVLCSGGHDGSVRLWDLASGNRACLQEFPGHRRRGDEGVCAVQYHPTMPKLLATGGADSVAKLWAWS